jgi:hypothetical protein
MALLNGPVYVPQPTAVIPRYGLFNTVPLILDLPYHAYSGGLQYELGVCTLPLGYTVNCQQDHGTKDFQSAISTKTGYPFIVYASIECGAVGLANYGQDRVRQFLYQQLTAGEQATVERIFSESANGQTEGLANNPATVNLGTADGPVEATSILENWLYAQYGLPGVIHSPMLAAAYMKGSKVVVRDNPNGPWTTAVGTKVSFGNYAGVGPTGQTPTAGTTWMYITGQMAIWRAPDSDLLNVPIGQVLNRSTNVVDIVMEREYVVTYDCYVAGVQVTLDLTTR